MQHAVPPLLQDLFNAYQEQVWRNYEPSDARFLQNHRGHLMMLRQEEERLVTGDLIRSMTSIGTRAELVEHVRALNATG